MSRQLSALHVAFGARVRAQRVQRGMSQAALASASGLHRSYVGGVERGERNLTLGNMERLAVALDVPIAELLQDVPEPRSL